MAIDIRNDTELCRIFLDCVPWVEQPEKFSDIVDVMKTDGGYLCQMKMDGAAGLSLFTWYSRADLDFALLQKAAGDRKIILQALEGAAIVNLPPRYSITEIDRLPVYWREEYADAMNDDDSSRFHIIKLEQNNRHLVQQLLDSAEADADALGLDIVRQSLTLLESPILIYAIVEDGAIAALVSLSVEEAVAGIGGVYTKPARRGCGYAAFLLQWVMRQHRHQAYSYHVSSAGNTASEKLAVSCGFKRIGRRVGYAIEKRFDDALVI